MIADRYRNQLILAAMGAAVTGCASTPDPAPDIARAAARVEQAQQAGAAEAAGLELKTANDNLRLAREAVADGDEKEAVDLARRAEADAGLAEAKARRLASERAAAEVQSATEALRNEAERVKQPAPPVANPVQPVTPIQDVR